MERQIIALLQKRDEQALEEIRRLCGPLCFQLAYRILGSREDAEECVSDMLLAVWNSRKEIAPENLKAFLVALTRHIAIDRLKRQTRQKRGGREFALALDELAEILPAQEQVENQVEQRALAEALAAFLRTLPPQTARLFLQRYYGAESVKDIAAANGMRVSAVKMALMRTRNKLKAYLEQEGLL